MSPEYQNTVSRAIELHRARSGGLLPLLHEIQHSIGFIPPESVDAIAAALNLSRAEVHGVLTYYTHFRSRAPARHSIQLCQAEACQSMGAEELARYAQSRLGCEMHTRSADGNYSLEPVYCLGLCASSPSMMIGDQVFGRVTPGRFDQLVDALDKASS